MTLRMSSSSFIGGAHSMGRRRDWRRTRSVDSQDVQEARRRTPDFEKKCPRFRRARFGRLPMPQVLVIKQLDGTPRVQRKCGASDEKRCAVDQSRMRRSSVPDSWKARLASSVRCMGDRCGCTTYRSRRCFRSPRPEAAQSRQRRSPGLVDQPHRQDHY